MTALEVINKNLFESIKLARELQSVLGYKKLENFSKIIEKAKEACKSSDNVVDDHFSEVRKMVYLGSGSEREIIDYELSRYACYLIAMNGSPSKKAVALAQTYFAVKTRQQELIEEEYQRLTEDQKRLITRRQVGGKNRIGMTKPSKAEGIFFGGE